MDSAWYDVRVEKVKMGEVDLQADMSGEEEIERISHFLYYSIGG